MLLNYISSLTSHELSIIALHPDWFSQKVFTKYSQIWLFIYKEKFVSVSDMVLFSIIHMPSSKA